MFQMLLVILFPEMTHKLRRNDDKESLTQSRGASRTFWMSSSLSSDVKRQTRSWVVRCNAIPSPIKWGAHIKRLQSISVAASSSVGDEEITK